MDPIDKGLERLRAAPANARLEHLEGAVFCRIESESRSGFAGVRLIPVQLAVSCAALLIGLVMAQLLSASSEGFYSETIVLSEDIAPSVRLEGGGA
jgi:hypothetical protein